MALAARAFGLARPSLGRGAGTMQDLRFAFRALRKNPGFTAVSVATLTLAIGLNTAMFGVLNAVVLRPLPYHLPDQLAMLWSELPDQQLREGRSAYVNVAQWRRQSQSFADMAVFDPVSLTLTDEGGMEQISGARVSPNLFPLLGVRLLRGRSFSAEEAEEGRRLVVISHRLWQTRFGGSPAAVGAAIELDRQPSRIVGVLAPGFQLARLDADVWEPHTMFPDWQTRRGVGGPSSWYVIGRMRPEVSVEQAQAEMSAIARRLEVQPGAGGQRTGVSVVPLADHAIGSRSRSAVWMLAAAAFFVLLIAAANVAGLSVARGVGRAREIAIRAALGASSGRIARQLLAESAIVAAVSGLLGTLLALAAVQAIAALAPGNLPRLAETTLDLPVLAWTLVLSLLTGTLVGLAPAITLSRRDWQPARQEGGRGATGGLGTRGIRRVLVVSEFALALVLLVGAGLLVRSWWHLERVDLGFRPERVLSMQVSTPVPPEQRADFYQRMLEQIASVPQVESAGVIGDLFIGTNPQRSVTTEGEAGTVNESLRFRRDEVSDRLFATLGAPLLRGRLFSGQDGPRAPRVAILNESMARRLWPGRDPLGKRFRLGPNAASPVWFTVVGVVADMRRQGLENEPVPQMFEPLAQNPSRLGTLLVRTSLEDPLKLVGALRAAVRGVEAGTLLYSVTTLDDRLGASLTQRRFQTWLLIGFSAMALLLAALGIYGLFHHAIATRTREIGIRLAVGAQTGDVFRMVIGEGLRLSLAGLALGVIGSWWLAQAISSLLFGVTANDPLTFVAVSLLLTGVAVAACVLPARRATKVDPMVALRQD
jgi:putative ABC transport system permease protein